MISDTHNLETIQRLRKLWIVACTILVGSVALFYFMSWSLVVREFVVLVGVAVYGLATLLLIFTRCPRCGHLFHNVLGFNNPFSRVCSHCGLPLAGDDVT